MFPKSTHETFCQKLYQTFSSHKCFVKPKLSSTNFAIAHFAGEVLYQADQFLDKNKDYVVLEHQELLRASKSPFLVRLFPPVSEESTKSSKFSSIASRFKTQLQQLIETLNSTEPHYIRCVKPNNLLKPGMFENVNIMQQLRCGGVLEAIRICSAGYPSRRVFNEFLKRYGVLAPDVLKGNYDERNACVVILETKGFAGFQMGKTKVFLRARQLAELDAWRTLELDNTAKAIQRRIRTHIARNQFSSLRKATICVQALWRRRLARNSFVDMKREASAIKLQKNLRRYLARKAYTQVLFSSLVLQTGLRTMAAQNKFQLRKQTKAAIIIQARWRCHQVSSYYKMLKRASITFQCRGRRRFAKRELNKLKMASKETGELKEAKNKLEKRVEELTRQLQLERIWRAELEETKGLEIMELQNTLQAIQNKLDETNAMLVKEREAAQEMVEEVAPVIEEILVPVEVTEKIDSLTAQVESLQALLQSEKQRSLDIEKICNEAQESNEERRKKLEATERKVDKLQEYLNRMMRCFSNQVSELKMFLFTSSSSSSTSRLNDSYDGDDATTNPFSFPTPVPTPISVSSLTPDALRQIVQEHSPTTVAEPVNWENEREGAFDDFF